MKRFNYIQLSLYPIAAAAGVILLSVWLVSLLDIDWIYLQENRWAVNMMALFIIFGIATCLGMLFYCYSQLMRLIVKGMSWDDLEKELEAMKRKYVD